jgi:hypothetical protein
MDYFWWEFFSSNAEDKLRREMNRSGEWGRWGWHFISSKLEILLLNLDPDPDVGCDPPGSQPLHKNVNKLPEGLQVAWYLVSNRTFSSE